MVKGWCSRISNYLWMKFTVLIIKAFKLCERAICLWNTACLWLLGIYLQIKWTCQLTVEFPSYHRKCFSTILPRYLEMIYTVFCFVSCSSQSIAFTWKLLTEKQMYKEKLLEYYLENILPNLTKAFILMYILCVEMWDTFGLFIFKSNLEVLTQIQ